MNPVGQSSARHALSAVLILLVLVVMVMAGGLSYYVFSRGPSYSLETSTGPQTSSASSSTHSSSSLAGSTSSASSTTQVSLTSSTTSRTTTDSTSIISSSSSSASSTSSSVTFRAPAGGSAVIIPEGIQDANAKQENITFIPYDLKVEVGVNNTIYFYNADLKDNLGHVIESVAWPSGGQPFAFALLPGRLYNLTLTTPGTYEYDCEWHPVWMIGTITVLG